MRILTDKEKEQLLNDYVEVGSYIPVPVHIELLFLRRDPASNVLAYKLVEIVGINVSLEQLHLN